MLFEKITARQLKLLKVSPYMQKQVTFRLENKMFYFPNIAQFPKNAVEYRAFSESIPTNSPQMLNVLFSGSDVLEESAFRL